MIPIHYPHVRRDESVVDNYHGTLIPDPYRWLENVNSEEVNNYIVEQNQLTREFVDKCKARHMINARLTNLWSFCEYECPFHRGDRYFYFKDGVLYMVNSLDVAGDERQEQTVLNIMSENLPNYDKLALSSSVPDKTGENFGDRMCSVSPNGFCIAFGVSCNGSVWSTIHFKDVNTGELYSDTLEHIQNTFLSWTSDSRGLFYAKYPDESTFKDEKIFYHVLGTNQSEDKLIAEFPENPTWELVPKVSDCGEYLITYILEDCSGHALVQVGGINSILNDSRSRGHSMIPLVTEYEANYDYITNSGPIFYFLTNKKSPKGKIVRTNISKKRKTNWKVVLKEHKKDVLDWAACVNKEFLITCYISDAKSTLQLRTLSRGSLLHIFPLELGNVGGHCGRREDSHFFFKFSSFLTPGIVLHIDFESMPSKDLKEGCCPSCILRCEKSDLYSECEVFFESLIEKWFDPATFTISQVFYSSKDKTKNLIRDGNNPCLLSGYGGFNVCLKPNFDPTSIVFMHNFGGVIAIVNIRGGGEYGSKWYEDGIGHKKQNCFDDFQTAAEYLIKMKYTCPSRLAIKGDSNGGLLVAACINQRPDLFGAAIAGFGVMDLLRFHKFTSGTCWISDYGCSDKKSDFENLLKFSPLHNVQCPRENSSDYPAILLITADHDERVLPLHSYKMVAELQSKVGSLPTQKKPILLRVETCAGHGDGMSFTTAMDEITDVLCFLMLTLQLTFAD